MHLKPKEGAKSLVCPSDRVNTAELQAQCERYRRLNAETNGEFFAKGERNFSYFFAKTFTGVSRTDLRDCEELVRSLDETQCAWNSSW